jgi:hypothetical protein
MEAGRKKARREGLPEWKRVSTIYPTPGSKQGGSTIKNSGNSPMPLAKITSFTATCSN